MGNKSKKRAPSKAGQKWNTIKNRGDANLPSAYRNPPTRLPLAAQVKK